MMYNEYHYFLYNLITKHYLLIIAMYSVLYHMLYNRWHSILIVPTCRNYWNGYNYWEDCSRINYQQMEKTIYIWYYNNTNEYNYLPLIHLIFVWYTDKYRITAVMKAETDISTSIQTSPIGWVVILVTMFDETITTVIIMFYL